MTSGAVARALVDRMQPATIISALAYECRKTLQMLEALAEIRAPDLAGGQPDPLTSVILRRRRNAAVLRSLLRAAGAERTLPPILRPTTVDLSAVMVGEARLLALQDRQLAHPDLPADLRTLIAEQREDVLQATLILQRLRGRSA